jgi:hypothetical protein
MPPSHLPGILLLRLHLRQKVDDLEKYQMYEDKEISMDLGADLRKADDVESTPKRLKLWLMMS